MKCIQTSIRRLAAPDGNHRLQPHDGTYETNGPFHEYRDENPVIQSCETANLIKIAFYFYDEPI